MIDIPRRSFLKALSALPAATLLTSADLTQHNPSLVHAGDDRTGEHHKAPRGYSQLDFKVLTAETSGGLFLFEHRNLGKGGPPRHLHYEQEEWFYFIEGEELVIEIGEKRFNLRPGDSVLAPRQVAHVWAYIGEKPGRMLVGFTPAGKMESFFIESSKPGVRDSDPQMMEAHGIKYVGPPLKLG